ncbi:MAG: hypothetical protein V4555_19610 [Acidobacteriota bacterium]
MPRFLALLLILAAPLTLTAQSNGNWRFKLDSPPNLLTPDPPWVPASIDNPRYPVRIRLLFQHQHFTGYGFKGTVFARVPATDAVITSFYYNCGRTFSTGGPSAYPARWLKPNKLQILMADPHSDRTQKCTLTAHP